MKKCDFFKNTFRKGDNIVLLSSGEERKGGEKGKKRREQSVVWRKLGEIERRKKRRKDGN